MKRELQTLLFLAFALPMTVFCQTTVTSSIFPVAGDTLSVITSQEANGFDRSLTGADVEWDLRGVAGNFLVETIYTDPSEGEDFDLFPDADLLDNSTNLEIYYKSFNNKIVEIGRSGLDPVLNAIPLTFNNEGEAVLRRAPMSYNDAYDDESSFNIAAPASIIPDTLLPGISQLVDSIRLTVETSNDDLVDAWGTLRLPGADYDVLRVKRTTTTNSILEVKAPFIGWSVLDENNPLTGALGEFAELLGENVTTSYQFFADGEKEILAEITYDDEDVLTGFRYKGELTTSIAKLDLKSADVLTYPNPTYGNVTFELKNLPKDHYKIVISNIVGKRMWEADVPFLSNRLQANLFQLQKGTYLYSVVDSYGRKITTKRLIIMTP